MTMFPYTVILVTYKYKQTRYYEVNAINPGAAYSIAIKKDMKEYPSSPFQYDPDGSYEVLVNHNLSVLNG